MLVLAAALGLSTAPAVAATPVAPTSQLRDLVTSLDGAGADPAAPRYRDLRKLDSQVQALAADRIDDPSRPPAPADTTGLTVTDGGRVMVDVYVDGSIAAARRALQDAGLDVVAVSDREPQRMVSGWLPAAAAPDVAAVDATRAVVAVPAPRTSAGPGSVVSQGDAAMNGPAARTYGEGNDGAGVIVGVISDSFNADGGMAAAQSSDDLPANTTILPGQGGPVDGTDEGRAMAELVYDTAPGIPRILFATGFGGSAASKAANIDALVAAGAKVITDDVTYPGEPFFQDGVVEQAVDRARAAGVAYFAAAGNSARQAWEGEYRDGGSGYTDFNPGTGTDTTQTVTTVPANATLRLVIQWDEAWGSATDAFAATLQRTDTSATVETENSVAGIPRVVMSWKNTTGNARQVALRIRRLSGTIARHLKYTLGGDFATGSVAEYNTASPTVGPDASGAAGALTTAAVYHGDAGHDTAEGFSSRGPLTHYFDQNGNRLATPLVRAKPDLAAPDGVRTTTPTFTCTPLDPSDCFFGTSAASPAATAVAALLWSANPTMPVSILAAIMTTPANAIDCLPIVGPDTDCGAGFLLADRAMAQAQDTTPPAVTASVTPASPDGANGWYRTLPSISWSRTDPGSPTIVVSGCADQSVTTEGRTTSAGCTARSAGGTASGLPVSVDVDTTPPAPPTFSGIATASYDRATLPAAAGIGCTATDAVSGVTGCTVTGYDPSVGVHLLTATAVNGAGLTSATTLAYTVSRDAVLEPPPPPPPPPAKRAAATSLSLGALKLATLREKGLSVSVKTALARTRLVVTLTAKIDPAHPKKATTVGTLTKTVSAGKQTLRVKLVKKARDKLKKASKVTITVTVAATAGGATTATLKRSLTVRR